MNANDKEILVLLDLQRVTARLNLSAGGSTASFVSFSVHEAVLPRQVCAVRLVLVNGQVQPPVDNRPLFEFEVLEQVADVLIQVRLDVLLVRRAVPLVDQLLEACFETNKKWAQNDM